MQSEFLVPFRIHSRNFHAQRFVVIDQHFSPFLFQSLSVGSAGRPSPYLPARPPLTVECQEALDEYARTRSLFSSVAHRLSPGKIEQLQSIQTTFDQFARLFRQMIETRLLQFHNQAHFIERRADALGALQRLEREVQANEARIQSLISDRDDQQRELDRLTAEVDSLNARRSELIHSHFPFGIPSSPTSVIYFQKSRQLAADRQTLEALEGESATVGAQIEQLRREINSLRAEETSTRQERDAALQQLRDRKSAVNAELQAVRVALRVLEEELDSLHGQESRANADKERLLAQARAAKDALTSQLCQAKTETSQLTARLRTDRDSIALIRQQTARDQELIGTLTSQRENVRQQLEAEQRLRIRVGEFIRLAQDSSLLGRVPDLNSYGLVDIPELQGILEAPSGVQLPAFGPPPNARVTNPPGLPVPADLGALSRSLDEVSSRHSLTIFKKNFFVHLSPLLFPFFFSFFFFF